MQMPTMDEMVAALASPVIPPGTDTSDPVENEMNLHAAILLDIFRSVTRIESKLDNRGAVAQEPAPSTVPVSNQLEW